MCENLYYTITEEEEDYLYGNGNDTGNDNDEEPLLSSSSSNTTNKIIKYEEDIHIQIELINYSYLTLKQLNLICDYYGISSYIRIAKCKKEDIVNLLVLYESTDENFQIVEKRKRMWKYLDELKNDAFMKKFIIK